MVLNGVTWQMQQHGDVPVQREAHYMRHHANTLPLQRGRS